MIVTLVWMHVDKRIRGAVSSAFSGKGCEAAGGSAGKLSRGTCSASSILRETSCKQTVSKQPWSYLCEPPDQRFTVRDALLIPRIGYGHLLHVQVSLAGEETPALLSKGNSFTDRPKQFLVWTQARACPRDGNSELPEPGFGSHLEQAVNGSCTAQICGQVP